MSNQIKISKDYFKDILRAKIMDYRKIVKFDVAPIHQGQNCITVLLGVDIEVKDIEDNIVKVKFVVKVPERKPNTEAYEYHELFVNENEMYNDIIPQFEQLFVKHKKPVLFKASTFRFPEYVSFDYVLMEDLSYRGYKKGNRLVGLDELHVKFVLEKLAKWHAASAKRVITVGQYHDAFKSSFFCEKYRPLLQHMNQSFEVPFLAFMDCFRHYKPMKSKLASYMAGLTDKLIEVGKVDEREFNVLNHGDLWIENIMFKYGENNKEIKDVLFVDFQLPKYGTPVMDLFNFLMTAPRFDIRLNNFDHFIEYYHTCLRQNLTTLRYNRKTPTLYEIHKALRTHSVCAFLAVQRTLPIALLDPSDNSTLETFLGANAEAAAFKQRMFLNPRYSKELDVILPWLMARKFL